MEQLVTNKKQLRHAAERYIKTISNKTRQHACVVGLRGDLGSGKTTFTKEVAHILDIKETVTSPTFVIQKKYPIHNKNTFTHLIHIDAYRLDSGRELEALGWSELINNPAYLIFIEWPEQVESVMPEHTKKITFTFIDESTRKIEW